jgi:hypothetical protein
MLMCTEFVYAAEAGEVRNRACPEAWSSNTAIVPVISSGSVVSPWGVNHNDKTFAKDELAVGPVEVTLDAVPVTADDLVNDYLTVASHCLQYRNTVVDNETPYHPWSPPLTANFSIGWLPAAVF